MFDADFLANIIVWRSIDRFVVNVLGAFVLAIFVAVTEWRNGDPWVAIALVFALGVVFLALRKAWRYGNRHNTAREAADTNAYDYNYDVRQEYAPAPLTALRAPPGARYQRSHHRYS